MSEVNVWQLFHEFNRKYFWGKLDKVKVTWSPRMTLCAGKTAYKVRGRSFSSCTIRLSQPLLSQRPHYDTVNTLLHEMIHAYLHVTQGLNYRDSHGPEFRNHMKRINSLHGSKITIYHNFHREVNKFRIHVYRCDGPCVSRRPFFGVLRRAIERPPGPTDRWWERHLQECGGTFRKIEGPDVKSSSGSQKLPSNMNRKSEMERTKSKLNIKGHKMDQRPSNLNVRKMPFDEDKVLERIKEKYANTKQTKLISIEETPGVTLAQNCKLVEGQMNYHYQPKSPSKIKVDKYIRRFREAKNSLGIAGPRVEHSRPETHSQTSSLHEHSSDHCPSKRSAQYNQCLKDYSNGKGGGSSSKQSGDSWEDLYETRTCHNCGSTVLEAEMTLHLQYCIDSDSENESEVPSQEVPKLSEGSFSKDAKNSKVVTCPSCMEKVKEEKIQEHLDQCLSFLTEEF